MNDREALDKFARLLLADIPLTADDWEGVLAQAEQVFALIRSLEELPLGSVEPAPIYKVVP